MGLATLKMETFKTAKAALEQIKIISNRNIRNEICGFLGYNSSENLFIVQEAQNEADDPAVYFLINPLDYLLFKEDHTLLAIFHSHVMGDEEPSEFDIKMAQNCCHPFLIFSLNTQKINIYEPQNADSDVNILEGIKALI